MQAYLHFSHCFPKKPGGQSHLKSYTISTGWQVPPFSHGLSSHGAWGETKIWLRWGWRKSGFPRAQSCCGILTKLGKRKAKQVREPWNVITSCWLLMADSSHWGRFSCSTIHRSTGEISILCDKGSDFLFWIQLFIFFWQIIGKKEKAKYKTWGKL